FIMARGTTRIYPPSLHDALPISASDAAGHPGDRLGLVRLPGWPDSTAGLVCDIPVPVRHARGWRAEPAGAQTPARPLSVGGGLADRKSTRLNSSHQIISYAVFCL